MNSLKIRRHYQNQYGFTLFEVVNNLLLVILFLGLILYFGWSYWRYSVIQESELDAFVNRLNIQDYVRDKIGLSTGLIIQNSIPDPNALVADPMNSNYWAVLHAVPGTKITTDGNSAIVYFKTNSLDSSRNVIMNGTQPYEDEHVLYVNADKRQLLVRTLANTAASGNILQTSCPPETATTTCPADKILVENLASITSNYYSRSGNEINHHSSVDSLSGEYNGPDFPLVEAIQFSIKIESPVLFQRSALLKNDTIVRITLRNT